MLEYRLKQKRDALDEFMLNTQDDTFWERVEAWLTDITTVVFSHAINIFRKIKKEPLKVYRKRKFNQMASQYIDELLTVNPTTPHDKALKQGERIRETVQFGRHIEMDICICGVEFIKGDDNRPYTEAILYDDSQEVDHSEAYEHFFGIWSLSHNGKTYTAELFPHKTVSPNGYHTDEE